MKKPLALILLTPWLALATLPAGVQWEVRTTGADTNGGGFVSGASGTDRSQSDTPFCTSADLAAVTTTVTSVSCPFSAASVGNIIQITAGGCSAGFYQVVSVSVVTATLDRSAGTASGCTFALGGGLLTIGQVLTALVCGNTIWAKSTGSFAITAALVYPGNNCDQGTGQVATIGYQTTHGDNLANATITTATNSIKLINFGNGAAGLMFRNLTLTSTAGTPGDGMHPTNSNVLDLIVRNCVFNGFNVAINGDFNVDFEIQNLLVFDTEIKSSVSHGITNSAGTTIFNSYIHNNGGTGLRNPDNRPGPFVVIGSVFYKNNIGINLATSGATGLEALNMQNTVVSDSTGDGVLISSTNQITFTNLNNIFYNNGGFGVNLNHSSENGLINQNNAYGANTSGARNNMAAGAGDVTLSADPFVARGSNNFALNSTAGGGTALKGAGFPGVTAAGTGFIDIGALDTQCAGGGGASACAFAQ